MCNIINIPWITSVYRQYWQRIENKLYIDAIKFYIEFGLNFIILPNTAKCALRQLQHPLFMCPLYQPWHFQTEKVQYLTMIAFLKKILKDQFIKPKGTISDYDT